MSNIVNFIGAVAVALVVGLGGTWYALSAKRGIETVVIGPWRATIEITPSGANPYVRAALARSGEMPVLATEAIVFSAVRDSRGEPLRAACAYRLAGGWVDARWWTLTVTDDRGRPLPEDDGPRTVNSAAVLRDGAGRFDIVLSAAARPGNWLSGRGGDRLGLVLRLYDTPLYVNGGLPHAGLPQIVAEQCP